MNSRLPGKQRAAFPPRTHRGARKNSPPPDLAVPALESPYAQPHGEGKTGAGPSRSLFRAIAPRKNSAPGSWFRGGTRYPTALKPPGDQLPIRPAFPAPRPAPLRRTLRVPHCSLGTCSANLTDVNESHYRNVKEREGRGRGVRPGSPGSSLTPPSGGRHWAGLHLHNGRPSVSPPWAGVPPPSQLAICWTTGWSLRPGEPVGAPDGLVRAVPGADWLWELPEGRGASIRAGNQAPGAGRRWSRSRRAVQGDRWLGSLSS